MSKYCTIENNAFNCTPIENNYKENIGPDATCSEKEYTYCN